MFSIRVKDPRSFAGRLWNYTEDVSGMVPFIFIVLKLTGVISWSWWWVLSPLWIGGVLFLLWIGLLAGLALVLVLRTWM